MLEFTECEESGQLVAHGDKTKNSYWINEGNSKTPHTLDVIDGDYANILRYSANSLQSVKDMAQLLDSIECGRSAPPVFIDSTKTWMYRDSSSIDIGTSPVFALQSWLAA